MPIISNKTQQNGAVSGYHKVHRIEVDDQGARAVVNSWATERSFLEAALLNWQQTYDVPFSALSSVYPVSSVEDWLASPAGPFSGGTVLTPEIDDIQSAKAQRWAEMKEVRNTKEWAGFSAGALGWFDSDPVSQGKVMGCVVAAQLALTNGTDFEVEFTRRDNTVIDLDAGQMVAVGLALLNHVQGLMKKGRVLRAAIEAATSISEVRAITWPEPPTIYA